MRIISRHISRIPKSVINRCLLLFVHNIVAVFVCFSTDFAHNLMGYCLETSPFIAYITIFDAEEDEEEERKKN